MIANLSAHERFIESEEAIDENDRLRAAAERVCWFDWSGNDSDAVAAVDALREALKQ